MSTTSALTIVGGAIGSYFGYPQAGMMIGSMIGGRIEQNAMHLRGPRLQDLSIQRAEEGSAIPIAFGSVRIAGNILQCTDKRQRSNDTSAGKGSGPKQTNYSYDVDIAVGLCAGPIVGVRRIWANSNLIYDASSTATASSILASGRIAAGIKIYTGDDAQLPDPTLEAITGIGKTPAYRGQAYVVFTTLQLADFGNQVPQFTFEVVATGSVDPYRRLRAATIPQHWRTSSSTGLGTPTIFSVDDVVRIGVSGGMGGVTYVYDLDGNFIGVEPRQGHEMQWPVATFGTLPNIYWAVGRLWDGTPLYYQYYFRRIIGTELTLQTGNAYGIGADASGGLPVGRQLLNSCLSADGRYIFSITAPAGSTFGSGSGDRWHITAWDGKKCNLIREGTIAAPLNEYLFGPGSIAQGSRSGMMESSADYVWSVSGSGEGDVDLYQIGTDLVLRLVKHWREYVEHNGITPYPSSMTSCFADHGVCVTVSDNGLCVHTRIPAIEPTPVPMSGVVSALCQRTGLQPADIDTSSLTDTLHGYVVGVQGSARGAIDPLRQYSAFDVAEEGGKLLFVPRGGPQVAQIPWDDLAAHESGDVPDPLAITLADETELPTVVTVVYPDPHGDYQVASQTARRNRLSTSGQLWPTAPASNVARIELPVAMSAVQAARVAETLLWDAFTARKSVRFAVSLKWAGLKVSDSVQILSPDASYNLRITKIDEQGLVRSIEALFEDSALYQSAPAAGVSTAIIPQTISLPGPTRVELMDIPLVRDTDDGAGYYMAMSRYLPGWRGASLYRSSDDGASWSEIQSVANPAIIGTALDVLPTWAGSNGVDEASRVTVQLPAGLELSSVTLLAMLNGANAALLGNELIQFRDATLTAANTYRLSGLLRARRGTEDALATHAINERFVLLSGTAGLARIAGTASEIGLSRQYKAVTAGTTVESANPVTWANTGKGLRPLSPVRLGAGRDGAGNIVIQWTPRTRFNGEWRDLVDASLSESPEQYDVEIWSSDYTALLVSKRTPYAGITVLASEVSLQSATLPLPISIRVWQLSATTGRGARALLDITLPAQVPAVVAVVDNGDGTTTSTSSAQTPPPLAVFGVSNGKFLAQSTGPSATLRTWSSADGLAWTQVGTDTAGPTETIRTSFADVAETILPSGTYVGWQAGNINSGASTWHFYTGSDAAEPTKLGYGMIYPNAYPISISNDGTKLVALARDISDPAGEIVSLGRISLQRGGVYAWHSSNAGVSWTKQGEVILDYIIGEAPRLLRKCTGGWLLVNRGSTRTGIWRTTDPDAVTGWSKVCSVYPFFSGVLDWYSWGDPMIVTSLEKIGSVWYAYVVNTNDLGTMTGKILQSADDGLTWTLAYTDSGYAFGHLRPVLAGPYPCYIEAGGRRVLINAGGWTVFSTDLPAGYTFDAVAHPWANSAGRVIAKATNAGTAKLFSSPNGYGWTATTGISFT